MTGKGNKDAALYKKKRRRKIRCFVRSYQGIPPPQVRHLVIRFPMSLYASHLCRMKKISGPELLFCDRKFDYSAWPGTGFLDGALRDSGGEVATGFMGLGPGGLFLRPCI